MPLRSNAVVHLSQAVAKVAAWQTPMRLNDTTREFFKRMASISSPEDAARYRTIVDSRDTDAVQEYFAANVPRFHSTLRTSISPNVIKGGYRINVIPSEAEATLDVRALPDEDIPKLLEELRKVINDPAVEVQNVDRDIFRPGARPSRLDTEAFKIVEAVTRRLYGVPTIPIMQTGATDMAYLRARGVDCYGVGADD